MRFRIMVVAATLVVGGCSSVEFEEDDGFVQRQWTRGIQRLGLTLTPVYPPSEDYQVGDVYGVGEFCKDDPAAKNPANVVPRAVRLGTAASVYGRIANTYRKRLTFDETGRDASKEIKPTLPLGPTPAEDPARVTPTPILAFPEFEIAQGKLAEFAGTTGVGLFGVLFGGSSKSDVSLAVKVKAAETYGIDGIDAMAALTDFCKTPRHGIMACSERTVGQLLEARYGRQYCGTYVTIVSRVYMTRHLQYNYSFASAQAFQIALAQRSADANITKARQDALVQLLNDTPSGTPAPEAGTDASATTVRDRVALALAAGVSKDLAKLAAIDGTAGTFSFSSYDNQSVSLDQSFARPIVFAYSGFDAACEGGERVQLQCRAYAASGKAPIGPAVIGFGLRRTNPTPGGPKPTLPAGIDTPQ